MKNMQRHSRFFFPKMELQGIVRGYVSAGKHTQVHYKSSKYSEAEPSLQPLHQTSS